MEAFKDHDAAKAAAIDDMDSFLDGLHRRFIAEIFEIHARESIDLQVAQPPANQLLPVNDFQKFPAQTGGASHQGMSPCRQLLQPLQRHGL